MQQRTEKKKVIDELTGIFQNPVSVLVIEYRGLDVKSMQLVRRQVKETNAELRVIKNKFLLKACEGTDVEKIKDLFRGPTAVAICGSESPATAKVFTEARKNFENLVIKGGLVDGKVCGVEEIEKISKLPSKQVLISMFASTLVTAISGFATALEQMRCKIVYGLEALKQTKDGQETLKTNENVAETEAKTEETEKPDTSADDAPKEKQQMKSEGNSAKETEKETEEQSSNNQNQKEEKTDG